MRTQLFLAVLLFPFCAFAQPSVSWDKTLGGTGNDNLHTVKAVPGGGFIAAGISNSPISAEKSEESRGQYDYWIVRLDAGGNLIWEKTFGGSANDLATDVIVTEDGGFLVGGYSSSGISGDKTEAPRGANDYWILKLDASGTLEWQKAYGGNHQDNLRNIVKTTDGYLLAGWSKSPISGDKTMDTHGDHDFWLIKIDHAGEIIWQKNYGGSSGELDVYASATTDGGFIVGGRSSSGISGDRTIPLVGQIDAWVLKLDHDGNIQWESTYPMRDFKSIRQTQDGGYMVAGSDFGPFGRMSYQYVSNLFKTNASGLTEWEFRLQPIYGECAANDILEQADGSFLMATMSMSLGAASCISKISADGALVWNRNFGVTSGIMTYVNALVPTDDGFLAGLYSDGNASPDKTQDSRGGTDYWLVKFGNELSTDTHQLSQITVFPIPVNDRLNIINTTGASFEIFNVLGQKLYGGISDIGQTTIDFPYPSGTYLLKMANERQVVRIIK